ncbi:DNA replication protein%2C putative [Streptococcus equi subsp. equi]|uniref:conserved phage C-terminal domain-containing protein n=1 Tax=Streptococcus equi TaxID=1336 RepID=UPI000658E2BD|nr:conserved phage C-terminal domain-containing protein [Streptococcus equi]HEL0027513.1 conserved phage C-terminal domain-containing protein [Streptococcus equi subsp. zooepidemicus]CRS48784.1 DNA replication protein%2C putative [Streptococcus equi subsp. equi]CRS50095.1 DNA replication protein%2C putative [Streptococcus equi subsp. equi]CRS67152.1 DNA replication protein%2C putative [Streptococcus equi subsp. equi]CRS75961.1 DNA replication protein%2C putative [Streptococcus equi subsp. equi
MAQRRMFSKKIIETDFFLEMSPTAKLLYFYLNMSADDDGFVGNPKTIKLISGATDDDLKILIAKQFIIPFDSGVIVIKDWRIHNYIQKDRYNKTQYLEEKSQLFVEENGAYTKCIQNVSKMDTQVRLGKERLGKENIYIVEQSPTEYLFPEWLEEKYVEQVKKGNPKNFDYRIPIAYLNQKTNSNYKFVDSNINLVKARLRDGYNLDDFKAVVDKKHGEWGNSDMAKYLRPSTLFNASKFESYLNQPEASNGDYYQKQQGQRFSQAELDELKKPDPKYGF